MLFTKIFSLCFASLFFITGCSSTSSRTRTHTVSVSQQISPIQVSAGRGDEIKWINNRSQPIALIFPLTELTRTSCRTGFQTVETTMLSAVVAPNSSASLCFLEQGKYDYQVRLDKNLASAASDRAASVWIIGREEGNPKPSEQYENINP